MIRNVPPDYIQYTAYALNNTMETYLEENWFKNANTSHFDYNLLPRL